MKKRIIPIIILILLAGNVLAGWSQLSHTLLANGKTLVSSEDENAQKLIQVAGIMSSAFSGDPVATLVFLLSQSDKENAQKYQLFGQMFSAWQTPDKQEESSDKTGGNAVREITGRVPVKDENTIKKTCKAVILINLEESGTTWQTTDIESINPKLSEESKSSLSGLLGEEGFNLPKTDGQLIIDEISNCGSFETITNMEIIEIVDEPDKFIFKLAPNIHKKANLEKINQVVVRINGKAYIFNKMGEGSFLTFHLIKSNGKIKETILKEAKIIVSIVNEYKFPNVDTLFLVPKGTIIQYKDGRAQYFFPKKIEKGPHYYVAVKGQVIPIKLIPNGRLIIEDNRVTGSFGFSIDEKDFKVEYGSVDFLDNYQFTLNPSSYLIEEDGTKIRTFGNGVITFTPDYSSGTITKQYNDINEIEIKRNTNSFNNLIHQNYCNQNEQSLEGVSSRAIFRPTYSCPLSVAQMSKTPKDTCTKLCQDYPEESYSKRSPSKKDCLEACKEAIKTCKEKKDFSEKCVATILVDEGYKYKSVTDVFLSDITKRISERTKKPIADKTEEMPVKKVCCNTLGEIDDSIDCSIKEQASKCSIKHKSSLWRCERKDRCAV